MMARVNKKGYSQLVLLVAFDFFFLSKLNLQYSFDLEGNSSKSNAGWGQISFYSYPTTFRPFSHPRSSCHFGSNVTQ